MVTIKDIATRLGISISTVSKGLNGASDISEDLRQLVLDTAVEMGYATKKSKKVENRKLAVFIENMEYETPDQFGYDIVLGFKQNAFRYKWDVTVIPVTPAFQLEEKYDTYLLKNGFCGAFLLGFALHDEWMRQLKTTTMPTVLLDNYIKKNPNVCYVGTDNYEGIDTAVDHLYTLGHKKIAFLNGSLHSMVSEERQEAYYESMRAHGLDHRRADRLRLLRRRQRKIPCSHLLRGRGNCHYLRQRFDCLRRDYGVPAPGFPHTGRHQRRRFR